MEEYGFGEVCKVLDDDSHQTVDFLLNCTQGINTQFTNRGNMNFEAVYDINFKDNLKNQEFWLKDTDRYIYLPWDPKITATLSIQDFKYLSDKSEFSIQITSQKQLTGQKQISLPIDISKIPKTSKPGGRMYFKIDLTSPPMGIDSHYNIGFLALKDYKEPQRSALDYYIQIFTLKRVLFLSGLLMALGLCIYMKRRKEDHY